MKKLILTVCCMLFSFLGWAHAENVNLQDETCIGKDSIEWVAFPWDEPKNREGKLERMLTTELQRKILFALQEKKYLKPGKAHAYRIDPFQVTDMRRGDGGFYQLTVLVTAQKVVNNHKIEENNPKEKYEVTFLHNYDLGFVVTGCKKLEENNKDR